VIGYFLLWLEQRILRRHISRRFSFNVLFDHISARDHNLLIWDGHIFGEMPKEMVKEVARYDVDRHGVRIGPESWTRAS
jgi:hypothetical protein